MKNLINKLFNGFLLGLGFSIALGSTYYFLAKKMTEEAMDMYSFQPGTVAISKHHKVSRDGKIIILGSATNSGDTHAKGINVIVDLYLNDAFVKQCKKSISGGIPSKESRNFEISCGGGCSENPAVPHDAYKIYVAGF